MAERPQMPAELRFQYGEDRQRALDRANWIAKYRPDLDGRPDDVVTADDVLDMVRSARQPNLKANIEGLSIQHKRIALDEVVDAAERAAVDVCRGEFDERLEKCRNLIDALQSQVSTLRQVVDASMPNGAMIRTLLDARTEMIANYRALNGVVNRLRDEVAALREKLP